MNITHENGYQRISTSPIIPRGAPGEWDDYFVYSAAVVRDDNGVLNLFYSGTRNVGANPRLEGSIGRATSEDGLVWAKQGKVIDKDDVPDLGLSPFSIIRIDGVYHMFCAIFNNGATTYNSCVLTSTDLENWSYIGKLTGIAARAHSPCVIEDPAAPNRLMLFYTSMAESPGPRIMRAYADKSDPTSWTSDIQVTGYTSIYPSVRWIGDRFEMFVAIPVDSAVSTLQGYTIHKTASVDGASFPCPSIWSAIIPRGSSTAFDYRYTTTPFAFEDSIFYSGRAADNLGYRGIGCAKLQPIGSPIGWDWTAAGVGPWTIAKSGNFGLRLAAGSKGRPAVYSHGVGRDNAYEIWVYDDMTTVGNFQNTFRITDRISGKDIVLGISTNNSASKYIYRLHRSATWVATAKSRSLGWHKLSFEVADNVDLKIDGDLVVTDTAFDTAIPFVVSINGYDAGIGYIDDFGVSRL